MTVKLLSKRGLSAWLHQKRAEVFKKWLKNEISLADAAAKLHRLGIPAAKAWELLQKT